MIQKRRVLHTPLRERHLNIIRLARMLFGSTNERIVAAALELYERKFKVLETGRRFMEDGKIIAPKGEDTVVDVETARIDYVKRAVESGDPRSVFDEPIPKEQLEALLSDDDA